jgi:hypothetical protein
MPAHKFKESQIVDLVRNKSAWLPPGPYEIIRLLPSTVAGTNQYQVKSLRTGQQLVFRETDLVPKQENLS